MTAGEDMALDISVELFTCLFSVICGIASGFIYDLFAVITANTGKTTQMLKELFYFILIGFISANVIRNVNDGIFRIYELVFLITGIFLYKCLLGRFVIKILSLFFKILVKLSKAVFKIVLSPIILLLKTFRSIIIRKYHKICKKYSKIH